MAQRCILRIKNNSLETSSGLAKEKQENDLMLRFLPGP